jgi:hypothetical protein
MPLANPFSEQRCGVNWLSLPNVLAYDLLRGAAVGRV